MLSLLPRVVAVLALTAIQPFPEVLVTEAQARRAAAFAAEGADGNEARFLAAYERTLIDSVFSGYQNYPVFIRRQAEFTAVVLGRAQAFGLAAATQARMMEPLDSTPWPPGVAITVAPATLDAPNIVKVVVSRNGERIESIGGDLGPQPFQNRLGATMTLGAGKAFFPAEAFLPNAEVIVTLIPATGQNIVRTMGDNDLRRIY